MDQFCPLSITQTQPMSGFKSEHIVQLSLLKFHGESKLLHKVQQRSKLKTTRKLLLMLQISLFLFKSQEVGQGQPRLKLNQI